MDLAELASKLESTVERKLSIRSKGLLWKEATLVVSSGQSKLSHFKILKIHYQFELFLFSLDIILLSETSGKAYI